MNTGRGTEQEIGWGMGWGMGTRWRVKERDDTAGEEQEKRRETVRREMKSRIKGQSVRSGDNGQAKRARQRQDGEEKRAATNNRLRRDELGWYTEYNVSISPARPPWGCVDGGMQ